ncbi:MAG: hypothetical protein Q9170_002510 [Blastenia crenularia]
MAVSRQNQVRDFSPIDFIPSHGDVGSKSQDPPTSKTSDSDSTTSDSPKDTLILYAYHETENARSNAEFFIQHGLHDSADFVFIFIGNGTDLQTLIPSQPNIRIVRHENHCYDIGSHGEALRAMGDDVKQYKRFIMMNASIRGPFVPHWSKECWSDAYLGRVTDEVKVGGPGSSAKKPEFFTFADHIYDQLVGMSYNCGPFARHVQSMIVATDTTGLDILLDPASEALSTCPNDHKAAVEAEVRITKVIRDAGFKVDAMMQEFQAEEGFANTCTGEDRNWEGAYDHGIKGAGMNLHPYEMLFFKAHRQISQKLFDKLTEWTNQAGYSSYGVCLDSRQVRSWRESMP